jgi:glycosyl transferase, family 25
MTPLTDSPPGIRCYVVSLRRRPDRRTLAAAQLPKAWQVEFTSDWDAEFDGALLDHDALRRTGIMPFPWRIESDNAWWSRPLKWGEVGCTLAHLACWRAAAASGADYAVFLEDDAVLPADIDSRLRTIAGHLGAPGPFDLLYLGRVALEPDRPTPWPGIAEPGYSHCTFGYVLTRRGLREVLATQLHRSLIPVDEFLPAMYHPHPRADVRVRFPPRLRALALAPPVVTQRPKEEAGSDTEASDFVTARS